MHELLESIPDVEVLLALEPEELGARLLFLWRDRGTGFKTSLNNLCIDIWQYDPLRETRYPASRRTEVDLALSEAWAWLEAQGLLIPVPGSPEFRALSRRAKKFRTASEFASYAVARRLPKEALHPKIADKVWLAFMRGDFDIAAFQAMKTVEVAVRCRSGLPDALLGVKLMRKAFGENGPLADVNAEPGERAARENLFVGAIGSYKNPQSHRDVNLNDPTEAAEIIYLASHLLRLVDVCIKAPTAQAELGGP